VRSEVQEEVGVLLRSLQRYSASVIMIATFSYVTGRARRMQPPASVVSAFSGS
jgi:hypothetical protein